MKGGDAGIGIAGALVAVALATVFVGPQGLYMGAMTGILGGTVAIAIYRVVKYFREEL